MKRKWSLVLGLVNLQDGPTGWRPAATTVRRLTREEKMQKQSGDHVLSFVLSNETRLIDSAPDGIVIINERGIVLHYNPAAVALLQYDASAVVGKNVSVLMPEVHAKQHDRYLREYFESGNSDVVELRREVKGRRQDGTLIDLDLHVSAAKLAGQSVFLAFLTDISERRQLERQLATYLQKLERQNHALQHLNGIAESASAAKTQFLANMSHEIRTPLTAVIGFAETILDDDISREEAQTAAATILRNGRHLLEIVQDILDLSKIEAGEMRIECVPCSPLQVFSEVLQTLHSPATEKNLRLVLEQQTAVPERIQSDPTRLKQILINLVGNAVKFTEIGEIRLIVRLLNSSSDGQQLQVDVVDSGIGMNEEQMSRLFKEFSQVDTSNTRRQGGTGLGLAISKRLARSLNGDVTVSSAPGEGSTFSLTVGTGPLEGVPLLNSPSQSPFSVKSAHNSGGPKEKLACRVLLVEDGPDNQRLISFLLKKAGASVTLAENGQVGLDLALTARNEGCPFDVILMDMQMPVKDGFDATRELREADYEGPVIALTAMASKADRDKCINAGCDDYMTKPIDAKRLVALVAEYAEPNGITESAIR
jgi:ammonium transporter, Amt family